MEDKGNGNRRRTGMDYNEFKNRLIERVKERIEGGSRSFFYDQTES